MILEVYKFKRKISKILLFVLLFSLIVSPINSYATQSSLLGTNAALGSPLVSDNFTIDNWDSDEMLCFGIFLSNFCQPFEDDYNSAFTEGASYGTSGRGLKALQFAAGGDVETSGYLSDMVTYCKNIQSQSYKDIYVSYGYWEYNENVNNSITGSPRRAYFDDLIPLLTEFQRDNENSDSMNLLTNNLIVNPVVSYGILNNYDGYLNSYKTYVDYAVLPIFYTDITKEDNSIIFDMSENWDVQILKVLFAKQFNKEVDSNYVATEEEGKSIGSALDETFKQYLGQTCPLVMDTFGNICMQYKGKQILIIPASANQHITKNKSYNYLNSLVLNNFVMPSSEIESKLIINAEETEITNVSGIWNKDISKSIGNFPIEPSDEITTGKLLITSDTDTLLMPYIYDYLKSQSGGKKTNNPNYYIDSSEDEVNTGTQTGVGELVYEHSKISDDIYKDVPFGKYFHDLLDQNSFINQSVQFHITGAISWVEEETDKGFFGLLGGEKRNYEDATVETTLGAYGLLSTLLDTSGTLEKKDILDYFYVYDESIDLEDTKQSLFSGSYYLAPTIKSLDGFSLNHSTKLFVNYYCKVMDGSLSVDSSLLFDDNKRQNLYSILNEQKGVKNTSKSFLTSENITTNTNLDFISLKANNIYKSFLNKYYTLNANDELDFLDENSNINLINSIFLGEKSKISGYDMSVLPFGNNLSSLIDSNNIDFYNLSRIVKVYKPSGNFNAISSVFGLEDGCQFELYSTYIYVTYLYFYGLLGGSGNNFNETLFKEGYFKAFTGENFTNGVTKEQMEEQTKLNVYKLLSLDKDGEKYRSSLIKSFIKTTFVEPLDKSMNSGGVGNVGAETSFLKVSMLEDNFLIGDIIKEHWKDLSMILFAILIIIAIFSGALNNKTLTWYFSIIVASSVMTFTIPYYLDIAPIVIEKYVNSHYKNTGSYWALAESIEYDKNTEDLLNSNANDTKLIAILNTLNFLDTDSSLMVNLDISQKVISNNAIDYDELQRLKTARWLLPSLMKQMSSTSDNYDYVSVPVTRLYENFYKVWTMYNDDSNNLVSVNTPSEKIYFNTLSEKEAIWSKGNDDNFIGYLSTKPKASGASNSTKSISRVNTEEPTHTNFYLLKDLNINSVYSDMQTDKLNINMWKDYAKKIQNKEVNVDSNLFVSYANSLLSKLNTYNQYQDSISQEFGYLWTTENLGTYFYILVKDTFDEGGSGASKNLPYLMLQLQGNTATNAVGEEVRTSFMHYMNTGYERDVCDMEEVFTNVMPYMYQMMLLANGTSDNNGLLGSTKMIGNQYYSDNYLSWLFRCNWVTKIYEDNLYSSSTNVIGRDANGIETKYEVLNISDPRCYPNERPMVFSEAQMHLQNLTEEDLTYTELKILEFNSEVVKRWTSLINYANTDGLEKEHVYRQMAMEALFAFNETFTRDNIIMTEKTLYPVQFDLRSISLITILRSLVANLTNTSSYMYGNLATELYENLGFLGYLTIFVMYYSMIFFGWIRDLFMVIAFISSVFTLILNFGSNSKNKFKSMGGWIITSVMFCVITMVYYTVINFLVGNPVVDTMVNFETITSSKLSSIPFYLWGLGILILTALYTFIIIAYFYQLWIGHKFGLNIKDGGFSFYYQVADNMKNSIVGATKKLGNKFGKTFGDLKNWGPGADGNDKKKTKQDVENQNVKNQNSESSSKNKKKNSNDDLSGQAGLNDNFNNGNMTSGDNPEFTSEANKRIRNSKKAQASAENSKRADIGGSEQTINNTTNNVVIENHSNDNFTKEAQQRIEKDSKK